MSHCFSLAYLIHPKSFPCSSAGKESARNVGDLGSVPGLGRSPGKGKGYPLQYSGLEYFMGCIIHGVTESDTTERLSLSLWGFPCSSLVKNLPAVQETGFDPWVGKIPWRRKWQPTAVSLPGKSHGQRSLVGCSPRGLKELGTTE